MPKLFTENFDDISEWEADNVEADNGRLKIISGNQGAAIRRESVARQINKAVAFTLHSSEGVSVYLSRNARHYTLAEESTNYFKVSTFKETDGTADYVDPGQSADGVGKTYGVRVLLVDAPITSGAVASEVVAGLYVGEM